MATIYPSHVQLAAVQSLVSHMEEGGRGEEGSSQTAPPPPNSDTWDLLVRAHLAEEDCDGLLVTLQRLKARQVGDRSGHYVKIRGLPGSPSHGTAHPCRFAGPPPGAHCPPGAGACKAAGAPHVGRFDSKQRVAVIWNGGAGSEHQIEINKSLNVAPCNLHAAGG